jgi:hypothetical protein
MLGPLRGFSDAHPQVAYVSTFALLMVPGILLSHWFLGEYFPGAALVPVAFVLSVSLYGVLAIPMLVLHASLGTYLWIIGMVVFAFLGLAIFRAFLGKTPEICEGKESAGSLPTHLSVGVLWVPFVALCAALAYASAAGAPKFYGDLWVYLAWVQEHLNADHLALVDPYLGNKVAPLSRVKIDGWLLEQAAFCRVSGLDPVALVVRWLPPTLVFVAMLAFYALARILLKSSKAAPFAGCIYALFLLSHLGPSQFTFGGEFVGRIAEDKFVAKFFFLPVALCLAMAFLQSRRLRYLAAFAFVCWSSVAFHPVGLAIIGLSMAGFGFVHVVLTPLRKEAWAGMVKLGATFLGFGVVPALFMLATEKSFVTLLKGADINSGNPAVLANMVFVVAHRNRILELRDGTYMMDPYLLYNPIILSAFLLGLPFLLLRLKHVLAAQLLIGTLLLVTVVCYVPPIATFFGNNIVVPGQLWRLAWPLPLAAVLTVGWMGWEATLRARKGLNRLRITPQITAFVPLVLLGVVIAVTTPSSIVALKKVDEAGGPPYGVPTCFAPVFPWIRDNITKPSVVLAPDSQNNTCLPAYSTETNVVNVRGSQVLAHLPALERRVGRKIKVPSSALDLKAFYRRATPQEMSRILRHHRVDYVMAYEGSPPDKRLRHLSRLNAIEVPEDEYFELYKVE